MSWMAAAFVFLSLFFHLNHGGGPESANEQPPMIQSTSPSSSPSESDTRNALDILVMDGLNEVNMIFGMEFIDEVRRIKNNCEWKEYIVETELQQERQELLHYKENIDKLRNGKYFQDLPLDEQYKVQDSLQAAYNNYLREENDRQDKLARECNKALMKLEDERMEEALNFARVKIAKGIGAFAAYVNQVDDYGMIVQSALEECLSNYANEMLSRYYTMRMSPSEVCMQVEVEVLLRFIQEFVIRASQLVTSYSDDEDFTSLVSGSGSFEHPLPRMPESLPRPNSYINQLPQEPDTTNEAGAVESDTGDKPDGQNNESLDSDLDNSNQNRKPEAETTDPDTDDEQDNELLDLDLDDSDQNYEPKAETTDPDTDDDELDEQDDEPFDSFDLDEQDNESFNSYLENDPDQNHEPEAETPQSDTDDEPDKPENEQFDSNLDNSDQNYEADEIVDSHTDDELDGQGNKPFDSDLEDDLDQNNEPIPSPVSHGHIEQDIEELSSAITSHNAKDEPRPTQLLSDTPNRLTPQPSPVVGGGVNKSGSKGDTGPTRWQQSRIPSRPTRPNAGKGGRPGAPARPAVSTQPKRPGSYQPPGRPEGEINQRPIRPLSRPPHSNGNSTLVNQPSSSLVSTKQHTLSVLPSNEATPSADVLATSQEQGQSTLVVMIVFGTAAAILVFAILLLAVFIGVTKYRTAHKGWTKLTEQEKVDLMKKSGYVNPTYQFFDRVSQ